VPPRRTSLNRHGPISKSLASFAVRLVFETKRFFCQIQRWCHFGVEKITQVKGECLVLAQGLVIVESSSIT
jgi:hypothetical protein